MAQFNVEIKNLDFFLKAIKEFPEVARREMAFAINKSLDDIRTETFPITPRKEGFLIASFDSRNTFVKATKQRLSGSTGPDINLVPYALFVHEARGQLFYKNPTKKGTLPRFVDRGVGRAKRQMDRRFDKAMENIIKRTAN